MHTGHAHRPANPRRLRVARVQFQSRATLLVGRQPGAPVQTPPRLIQRRGQLRVADLGFGLGKLLPGFGVARRRLEHALPRRDRSLPLTLAGGVVRLPAVAADTRDLRLDRADTLAGVDVVRIEANHALIPLQRPFQVAVAVAVVRPADEVVRVADLGFREGFGQRVGG